MAIEAYHASSIREQLIQIHKHEVDQPFNTNVWPVIQARNASCMRSVNNCSTTTNDHATLPCKYA